MLWESAGWHLLDPAPDGRLRVTSSFLKAYLARPELAPLPQSCIAEQDLHARLLDDPKAPVGEADLAALADQDAAQNFRFWLAFRDRLLAAPSLETAYLELVMAERPAVPPLFVDHLVHAILRQILDGESDAFKWRAAECLFRAQRVTITEAGIMLADAETIGRAVRGTASSVELDVLSARNAAGYAGRSERFDLVLDVAFTRPGLDALARVLEAWVAHFLGLAVRIQPVQTIRDERWAWHVGLDAAATGILNDMWNGVVVPQADLARILALFRLELDDQDEVLERVAGRPVYLAMAMEPSGRLRLKPQNLLTSLPLRRLRVGGGRRA